MRFTLSEPVDQPAVTLLIGSDDVSTELTYTADPVDYPDGLSWKADYQIRPGDNGTMSWAISGIDRAGNLLELGAEVRKLSLDFSSYDNFSYFIDTSSPEINSVVLVNDNHELSLGSDRGRKYGSESSVHLLKADDNITLSFQTTEPIDPPQVRLKIGENPVEMSRGSLCGQSEWDCRFNKVVCELPGWTRGQRDAGMVDRGNRPCGQCPGAWRKR